MVNPMFPYDAMAPATNGHGVLIAPALPQTQAVQAPEPIVSDLDRWAMRQYGRKADQLDADQQQDLRSHVVRLADQDATFWAQRDDRMRVEQEAFELSSITRPLGKEKLSAQELEAQNAHAVVLPDPYLYTSKITSMIAGAGLRMNMPARSMDETVASQQVENFSRWFWKEWADRAILYQGGAIPLRTAAHYACLRGWLAILAMPDSTDEEFPWRVTVPDPIHVYPRFTQSTNPSKAMARVIHRYTTTLLEAKAEYPELESADAHVGVGYQDDEEVEILSYWDSIYHLTIALGRTVSGSKDSVVRDSDMVLPPVRHGVRDIRSRPVNPWIIVTPLGNLAAPTTDGKPSTRMYGPGILFAMLETYNILNRVVSMQLTQVAKSLRPPKVLFSKQGVPFPEELNLDPDANNYMFLGDQDVKLLDPAPNQGNLGPLQTILEDRSNKATVPSIFYGHAGAVTSGFGVGLLANAARDILLPYTDAIQAAMRLLLRRVLEITYHITSTTHGTLEISAPQGFLQRQMGRVPFNPRVIEITGTQIDVRLGEITPQDRAAVASYVNSLLASGVMDRYTARVELGIDDPLLIFERQALESLLSNPAVAAELGPLALQQSDGPDLLLKAYEIYQRNLQMAQAAQAQAEAGRQAGNQPNQPNTVVPTELQNRAGQPPPGQGVTEGGENDIGTYLAQLMASRGGSPPRFTGR